MEFELPQVTRKLGLISEVMADAYYFVNIRMHAEEWERQAATGNKDAQKMMEVIDTFHRLCSTIKGS